MVIGGLDEVLEKSIDWDKTIENLSLDQQKIEDLDLPLSAWEPIVHNNRFGLKLKSTSRVYSPTRHALKQLAAVSKMREVNWLQDPALHPTKVDKATGEKSILFTRDVRDADLLRHCIETHTFQQDRLDQEKIRLFRTWKDGTLRAVLSQRYAKVNNLWYLQVLRSLLPNGRVIRWRGNADTLYFDVFLPETARHDTDSGYGGMLHCGNSEIGERRVVCAASILRMICTNGLIVSDAIGDAISRVHLGTIDLDQLQVKVRDQIKELVPTLSEGIERLLATKAYGVGDIPIPRVFAQLAIDNHFSKKHINGILQEWSQEVRDLGANVAKSAFGLQAGVTRFGQTLDNDKSVDFDRIGGRIAGQTRPEWDTFLARAGHLSDKQVERAIGKELVPAMVSAT